MFCERGEEGSFVVSEWRRGLKQMFRKRSVRKDVP